MAFTGLYRSGTGNSSEAIARVEMNELMKALNEELEALGLCIDAAAFMWLVLEVLVDQRKLLAQSATPPLRVAGNEAYTAGGVDRSELSKHGARPAECTMRSEARSVGKECAGEL